MPTVKARLSRTTGDGTWRTSSPYSAATSAQSVSAAVAAVAWQAAIAAWIWYGPGRPRRSAVSSRAVPSSIADRSQAVRSRSSRPTGTPAASVEVGGLDEVDPGDVLLGLRERPVGAQHFALPHPYGDGVRRRPQPVAVQPHPLAAGLLGPGADGGRSGGVGGVVTADQQHVLHGSSRCG
jgi:hypothetical protein